MSEKQEAAALADLIEQSNGLTRMKPEGQNSQLGIKRTALIIKALRQFAA